MATRRTGPTDLRCFAMISRPLIFLLFLPMFWGDAVAETKSAGHIVNVRTSGPSGSVDNAVDLGIRPDCSETPIKIGDLTKLAGRSTDMVDFLRKIPEGTLQGFTLVTNSRSLHRGKADKRGRGIVSPLWPRALRTSVDGKMTVSFVCDPKNPSYGKVEILYFDDVTNTFRGTEIDFGRPGRPVSSAHRVHSDPQSCVSCHGSARASGERPLKPVWPGYFNWNDCETNRGTSLYGGNDDNMGPDFFRAREGPPSEYTNCTEEKDRAASMRQRADFQKFRKRMPASKPCHGRKFRKEKRTNLLIALTNIIPMLRRALEKKASAITLDICGPTCG